MEFIGVYWSFLEITGVYWGLQGFTGVYWGLFFRNCSLCHINFIKGICYIIFQKGYNHLLEYCPHLIYCPYEDYVEKKTTKVAAVHADEIHYRDINSRRTAESTLNIQHLLCYL